MKQKSESPSHLKHGEDYILDDAGNMVLTRKFLLKRGHCCQSGCQNCPYDYHQKVDPNIPAELQSPWAEEEYTDSHDYLDDEIYE